MAASILIIEDESAIADVLEYALKAEGYATQRCTLGQDGLAQLRSGLHAMAILDVGLPDISGFEVCRQARIFTDIPILFLTARADEIDRIVGLEIGADDYVPKPFSPREVVTRVRVILRRRMSTPTASSTWFTLDTTTQRMHFYGQPLDLTRYEQALLQTLLAHPGRIYTRELLMEAIWHDALDTSDRTVDTHIKTLRAKLKAIRDDVDPIVTHRGLGYSLMDRTAP